MEITADVQDCGKGTGASYSWSDGAHATDSFHPDETYDVSSSRYPTPWRVDTDSRIGVLLAGSGSGLGHILGKYNIAAAPVKQDLEILGEAERNLNDLDVLLIGSGGLVGLDSSATFRTQLEHFVSSGGTLVVLTTPHGYEFAAVPGGLAGFGWWQDQACHGSSMVIEESHPVLAGQTRVTPTVAVDGFFGAWPEDADIILRRMANGQPGLLTYCYGDGRVIATTSYTDWAYGHGQASEEELRLIRDMTRYAAHWRTLDDGLPVPGTSIEVPIVNTSETAAATVRVAIYNPDGSHQQEEIVALDLPRGESAVVSVTPDAPPEGGIGPIGYDLVSSDGEELGGDSDAAAYVADASKSGAIGQADYKIWATTATERVSAGTNVTYSVNVVNNTDQDLVNRSVHMSVVFSAGWHWWDWKHVTTTSVNVAAHSQTVFLFQQVLTRSTFTRFHLSLPWWGGQRGKSSFKGVFVVETAVDVVVGIPEVSYIPAQSIPVTIDLTNKRTLPYEGALAVRLLDPVGGLMDTLEFNVDSLVKTPVDLCLAARDVLGF